MRRISLLLALVASLFVTPALADFTGKDASLATITFKNPGVCTSVVCVPVFQLYDGTNVVTLTTVGADAVSNTLTGLPTYARMLQFNGTTWDRWQGAIKAAANAYAAGSLAIGAGVDGWDITQGTTTDVAATAGSTGSVSAKLRLMTTQLNTINTTLGSPFQAGGASQGTGASGAALAGNPFRVGLSDGTNSQNWLAAIALADGVNGNNTGAVVSWLWNGTTYDRQRGDLTNGAFVNVKTSVLPTGAATSANQSTEITSLATIATNTGAAIPAGTAIIGKVGIDQTTPGTTNGVQLPTTTNGGAATVKGGVGVVNGGSTYQAVAASQTATVLQSSTGAAGDYLSHCVIYPTSTSPGVVTVFDNTNTAATSAILFAGGATSTSNLTPISVPVGAVSTAGAWKVTTGAAVSVVCFGKFS